ncbi:hypothetical protein H0H87_012122 [Tephrocybe sp. NHM501043]|nr:hypothetical protein H0H87_012122 [Tephrocybe sp. NHM501043]
MRLVGFAVVFLAIGALAGQIPVINGTFGGVLSTADKVDYRTKALASNTTNVTTSGPIRVVENSGICETTPNVYQASGYIDIAANQSIW